MSLLKKTCAILFIEIIKGLKVLHSNRIIYNDLKPENICYKSKILNNELYDKNNSTKNSDNNNSNNESIKIIKNPKTTNGMTLKHFKRGIDFINTLHSIYVRLA